MKADQKTTQEVTTTLKEMFNVYSKRDLDAALAFGAPDSDVYFLGSGADEKSVGIDELAASFRRDWAQSEAAQVSWSRDGKWLITQMHLSLPSSGQAAGQSWPQL